jgi:hypothetical protein
VYDLFAAATIVSIGDGKETLFRESAWPNGMRPKDALPLIYGLSKKKKSTVSKALGNAFWVSQINIQGGLNPTHYPICQIFGDVLTSSI